VPIVPPRDAPGVLAWLAEALHCLGNRAGLPYLLALLPRPDTADVAAQRAAEICRRAGIELDGTTTWNDALAGLVAEWRSTGAAPPADQLTQARIAAHLVAFENFQLREVDEARFVLARLGSTAMPLLREALPASEPYLRTHVLEILRELGPAARDAAQDVLPLCRDELTRADALRVLGRIGATEVAPHVLACLTAGELEVRAAAAEALGGLRAEGVIPALAAVFDDVSESLDVRVRAAASLAVLVPYCTARTWLEELLARGDYHRPTLQELLERSEWVK
jgi:hypothetical protein